MKYIFSLLCLFSVILITTAPAQCETIEHNAISVNVDYESPGMEVQAYDNFTMTLFPVQWGKLQPKHELIAVPIQNSNEGLHDYNWQQDKRLIIDKNCRSNY